jgi:hypothetical protein
MTQFSYINLVWIYLAITAVYISYKVCCLLCLHSIFLTIIGLAQSILHSSPWHTRAMVRSLGQLAIEDRCP